MATAQIDAVKELQDSFQLLLKNWLLAVPTAIVSLIAVILFVAVLGAVIGGALAGGLLGGAGHMPAAGALLGGAGLLALIGCVAIVLLSLVAGATVMFGAADAWAGRPVDLASAMSSAFGKLPQLIVAGILIFLISIIPFVLIFVVIGVPLLLAVAFFLMYVMPAIVAGNRSGTEAIGNSFNLAKTHLAPSLIAFIGIAIVLAVGQAINFMFSHVFVLNFIVGFAVGGLANAYAAIVAVRFYELLSRAGVAPGMRQPVKT